jgi:D-tyrosyl-tRNA(Tyr) deacylase
MRAVLQRVSSARVQVAGSTIAEIQRGLLVLVGIESTDTDQDLAWLADKLINLRIFEDAQGKMNLSVLDTKGALLLVPNFTLAGDAKKGRRPSFDNAMRPDLAEPMFKALAARIAAAGVPTATGAFREMMQVSLVNEGPITIILETGDRGSPATTKSPAQ